MPTTSIYALRYPASTAPADVPTDLGNLAADVEAALNTKAHGAELAYAQITAAVSVTSTTEAAGTAIVTAPAFTADGSTQVMIEFFAPYINPASSVGATVQVALFDGATEIGKLCIVGTPAAGTLYIPVRTGFHWLPSAGAHTYSVTAWQSAGNGIVGAGNGGVGNYLPAFIRVTRV